MKNDTLKPSHILKITAALLGFIMLLCGLRFVWVLAYAAPEYPHAVSGVLDLRNSELHPSRSIPLEGEWEFYPSQLLESADFKDAAVAAERRFIQVPGDWRSAFEEEGDYPSYGYGTYRLLIRPDASLSGQSYGFWVEGIRSSSELEIEGSVVAEFGQPAAAETGYEAETRSYTAMHYHEAPHGSQTIEVIVRAANFSHPVSGGIVQPVRFGTAESIDHERWSSIGFQLAAFLVLLLHVLYAVILYIFNPDEKAIPVFIMLLLAAGLSIVSGHDAVLRQWLPLSDLWVTRLEIGAALFSSCLLLLLIRRISRAFAAPKALWLVPAAVGLYMLFISLAPEAPIYYSLEAGLFDILYMLPLIWSCLYIMRMALAGMPGSPYLLLTVAAIVNGAVWSLADAGRIGVYYPVDTIAVLIGFSAYWFKRYFLQSDLNAHLNRRLMESDKTKDEFLANTAHELQTPLHGIMNLAQSMIDADADQASLRKSGQNMAQLVAVGKQMSRMINDLLDLSRLRDRKISLQLKPVSLPSAAAGVADMLRPLAGAREVELVLKVSNDLPLVYGDEKRIVQILFSLLQHALQSSQNGAVTLSAAAAKNSVEILVSAPNMTLTEDELEGLLGPYEEWDEHHPETGLALSIGSGLIELHGSILGVNKLSGGGTAFTFDLPLASSFPAGARFQGDLPLAGEPVPSIAATGPAGGQHPKAPAPGHGRKLNILAVDDDPVNLKVLSAILPSGQFRIRTADNGPEVLSLLASSAEEWDLLIADVMMPQMSGYELTRKVRERYSRSELPVLLLTARNESEDIHAGFSAGASDYLVKPVGGLELQYRVWSLASFKRSVNERLRLEAAYLQAQIRPPFIFGALELIQQLSEQDSARLRELIEAFSSYLRTSFHAAHAEPWTTLQQEVELVRAYLAVEKFRLKDRLTVTWDIQAGLQLTLPPLILQPIVEHAVNERLLPSAGPALLDIRIERADGSTRFTIADNGTVLQEDQIRRLLDPVPGMNESIGVTNANRRLLQRYGSGLKIRSGKAEGTVVTFGIPDFRPAGGTE